MTQDGLEMYLINLNSSTERLARMKNLFGRIARDAKVFRLSAVRGSEVLNNQSGLLPGKIGNLCSHMLLWSHISKKNNNDFYIIFEDDIQINIQIEYIKFYDKFLEMILHIPNDIEIVHLSREINKFFEKNPIGQRIKPIYSIIGKFQQHELRRCSPIFPWSTMSGCYMLRPTAARALLRYGFATLQFGRYLPFSNSVDILLCLSHVTAFRGAMVSLFLGSDRAAGSDIRRVNRETKPGGSIILSREFFSEPAKFLSPLKLDDHRG